ncbi:MAG: hypothetical protein JWL89_681 [Candidatus Saccharibacteria bacterium]|jgi:hypothetical protein|nr:hypothetical protein [Candidatus Saccharibacteria bacterium]
MTIKPQSKIKTFAHSGLLAVVIGVAVLGFAVHSAKAAGNAIYSITPSSGTYTVGDTISAKITENSGTQAVNAVHVDLSYDPSVLQFISLDASAAAFSSVDISTDASGGVANIIRAQLNGQLTGSQTAGTLVFKVIGTSSGTPLRFVGATAIVASSIDHSNLWNDDPAGANFVLKAAAVTPPTPVTPPASSGGSSSSKPASGGSTTSKPTKPSTTGVSGSPTPATTPNTTGATGETPGILTPGTYFVAIKVHDSKDKAVVGATVTLDGKTLKTDANGLAGFIGVAVGTYNAKVTYSGKTQSQSVKVVQPTSDKQNLQEFNIKLASHATPSWLIYGLILLVIAGLGIAGFIIPRKNKFNPPSGMGGSGTPDTMVVGDLSKPISIHPDSPKPQTPGSITKPTNEEQKP